MKKVYVQVDSERLDSGEILPVRITWHDGRVWNEFATRYISVVRKNTFTELVTRGT